MSNLIRVFVPAPDEDDAVEPDVTVKEALDLAIFSINTFLYPDASEADDCNVLEARGGRAIDVLVAIRDQHESLVVSQ